MRYDLTRLGPHEFENLSQALAIAVLGNAVSVFGDGPDGGREATFEGRLAYPDPPLEAGLWNGYGVVQAKFKRAPTSTTEDTAWFLRELDKELKLWADPESGRRKRGRQPRYLVVTTNVNLSADPGRGGIDRARALLKARSAELELAGWALWPHDQICRFLDVHASVRRTYGGLAMAGDVLAEVQDALARLGRDEVPETEFSTLLTNRAAKELLSQQWVRLSEAGHPTNQRLMLSDVGVDLPARPRNSSSGGPIAGVVAHVVALGNTIRRPRPGEPLQPHLAIVGGPGQGKTTLGQLICQTYRVAALHDRPQHTLGPEVPALLGRYRSHLASLGIPVPTCRRWPVRVLLSEFADELAERPATTLLGFIAAQSREISPINPRMMREWLRNWPWLLVLDGLDEVVDPDIRQRTISAISDFYIEAASVEADLFVVSTTRPQGYQNELSAQLYDHFVLDPMTARDALAYAEHLTAVRFPDDPDMHEQVLARLRTATHEPVTSRLMRTPLQVTIMSILLERRSRAPRDRHGLFEAYYTTLYEREVAKNTPTARLLDEQRTNVDHLHEQVGQLLQRRAEQAGEAEAHLPLADLERIALERLQKEEYPAAEASRLANELTRAATDRLVLLVGYANATVGFEVRSLQELMAARSFFGGTDPQLLCWLRSTAQSAHWRNAWLFAVSRLFAQRQALRQEVVLLLDDLDSESPLAARLRPGARLAIDMLDEDVVAVQPRYRRLLVTHALRLLDGTYPGASMTALARVVNDAVAQDVTLAPTVRSIVDSKLTDTGRRLVVALDFLAAWSEIPGAASTTARSRMQEITRRTPIAWEDAVTSLRGSGLRAAWSLYTTAPLSPRESDDTRIGRVVHAMRGRQQPVLVQTLNKLGDITDQITELDDLQLQEGLVAALTELDAEDWRDAAAVERRLLHWRSRQPIPDAVLDPLSPPPDLL